MELKNRIVLTMHNRLHLLRKHNYEKYKQVFSKKGELTPQLDEAKAPKYLDEVSSYIEERAVINLIENIPYE